MNKNLPPMTKQEAAIVVAIVKAAPSAFPHLAKLVTLCEEIDAKRKHADRRDDVVTEHDAGDEHR